MADTQRSLAALLVLLADNATGDISPQDVRDMLVSLQPRGGDIAVLAADRAAVTIADTTNYVEVTAPVWTLDADSHADWDESGGNGRLTYLGVADVTVQAAGHVSMTAAANNQVIHFRLMKNGTTAASSEVQRKVGTGADVGAAAMSETFQMSTGDYLSLAVRNATSTASVTVECAAIHALTALK